VIAHSVKYLSYTVDGWGPNTGRSNKGIFSPGILINTVNIFRQIW